MKKEMVLRKVGMLFNVEVGVRLCGDEVIYKPEYIMWVSPRLVRLARGKCYIELPAEGVDIARGKGGLALRPGSLNLFDVRAIIGMYGDWDEVKVEVDTDGRAYFYHIAPGHEAVLVLTDEPEVKYRWRVVKWIDGKQIVREGLGVVELDGTVREVEVNGVDAVASVG